MIPRRHRLMLAAAAGLAVATLLWLTAAAHLLRAGDAGPGGSCLGHPDLPAGGGEVGGEYSLLPPGLRCWSEVDGQMRKFAEPSWTDSLLPTGLWLAAALVAAVAVVLLLRAARALLPRRRRLAAASLLWTSFLLATAAAVALIAADAMPLLPWLYLLATGAFIAAELALQPALGTED